MKAEPIIENVVILFDHFRSSHENDQPQFRLNHVIKGLLAYIEEKTSIDPNDRIILIQVGVKPETVGNFDESPKTLIQLIEQRKFEVGKPSIRIDELENAMKLALELLSARIRLVGEQIYRIFLITDSTHFRMSESLQIMVKNAAGLHISMDVCVYCDNPSIHISRDDFLSMTQSTQGEFGFFYNPKALLTAMKGYAAKKSQENTPQMLVSSRVNESGKYFAEIALPLQLPTSEELKEYAKNRQTTQAVKCQICFSFDCPSREHDFIQCGRQCPNCGRLMHLHCAGLWAKKAEVVSNVFRCPTCYTLLRLPPSVIKGLESKEKLKNKGIPPPEVKMIRIKDESFKDLGEICSACYAALPLEIDPEQKMFRCSQCDAIYHEKCLGPMYKATKSCQNCGGHIV